ncbi:hypothetical protein [Cellulomonas sp. URHB0016]
MAGVLADLSASGARRLDLRSVIGLVCGGLATRRRTGPPLVAYAGYVLFEARLPAEHRRWAWRDIQGPRYRVRRAVRSAAFLVLPATSMAMSDLAQAVAYLAFSALAVVAGMLVTDPSRLRRAAMVRHLAPPPGRRADDGIVRVRVCRRRLRARPGSTAVLAAVTLGAVVWTTTAWWAPRTRTHVGVPRPGWLPLVLVVALAAGLLGAVLVARRLGALVDLPDQPRRVAVDLQPQAPAGFALASILLLAVAVLELIGAWGFPRLSVVGAPPCVASVPAALVVWRHARRAPDDVRLVSRDLVRVAVTGRPLRPDTAEVLWVAR